VQVNEAIRQQILSAVDSTYYDVLEDDTFGYADVTIIALLTHLQTTYVVSRQFGAQPDAIVGSLDP
jgi:hypothetical protein